MTAIQNLSNDGPIQPTTLFGRFATSFGKFAAGSPVKKIDVVAKLALVLLGEILFARITLGPGMFTSTIYPLCVVIGGVWDLVGRVDHLDFQDPSKQCTLECVISAVKAPRDAVVQVKNFLDEVSNISLIKKVDALVMPIFIVLDKVIMGSGLMGFSFSPGRLVFLSRYGASNFYEKMTSKDFFAEPCTLEKIASAVKHPSQMKAELTGGKVAAMVATAASGLSILYLAIPRPLSIVAVVIYQGLKNLPL